MSLYDEQITENFNMNEFVRQEDWETFNLVKPLYKNLIILIHKLQVVRDFIGLPMVITEDVGGYRTPEANIAAGGVENSYHCKGMAADIIVDGMSAKDFQKELKNWSGGMCRSKTFTHLDWGPKRRWDW